MILSQTNTIKEGTPGSSAKYELQKTYYYNGEGRLYKTEDALGNEITHGFDSAGRQVWTLSPKKNCYTVTEYDTQKGQVIATHFGYTTEPTESQLEEGGVFFDDNPDTPTASKQVAHEYDETCRHGRKKIPDSADLIKLVNMGLEMCLSIISRFRP